MELSVSGRVSFLALDAAMMVVVVGIQPCRPSSPAPQGLGGESFI